MARVKLQDLNSSLALLSSTSIVDCGTDTIGTGDVTVMGWIYQAQPWLTAPNQFLVNNGSFIFFISKALIGSYGRTLAVSSNGAVAFSAATVSNAITENQWIHVGVRRVGTTVVFYINGVEYAASSSAGTPAAATTNLFLGNRNPGTPDRPFKGLMKDWCIVNRICTNDEVIAHTNGTTPAGATNVYKLDEGSGTVATDTSGNGNNGTITNGTWTTDTPSKKRTPATGRVAITAPRQTIPITRLPA